ncbi:MAG: DUF6503 family protein [Bacteroidota bacterium]
MKTLTLFLSFLPFFLFAQFKAPASSPHAVATTTAGYTEMSVDYHRPCVRGRVIFGQLQPWGTLWRAGANENTLLRVDREITIGDSLLYPGTYSLYLIPEEEGDWTWVVNRDIENWGTRSYDKRNDVVRVKGKARRLPERIKTLEYRWMNVTPQAVDLTLEWEWYRITLPIALSTDAQVADRASIELNPAGDPNEYYLAARYYLDNGDLQKAKAWIDRWDAQAPEQFGRMRYQAIIEHRLGNAAKAHRLMERSLELAREKGNEHYVRMNQESLREWRKLAVTLPPDSLLARSIRYHDPEDNWMRGPHLLQIAESRPTGDTRQTRVGLYPHSDEFDLRQTRGKDNIQLRYVDSVYSFSHQGRTDIADTIRRKLQLTEERTRLLRDYYTYLWGLPMKLRDPGTELQPTVHKVWFDDRELLELEVHYAPEAGKDVWFFYFDPETYALSGYSFYHAKDGPGTGEYILLENEATVGKMKLPAERHWYYTKNNLYLGTDEILR